MHTPASNILPCIGGIGLRVTYYRESLENLPKLGWVKLHIENFFAVSATDFSKKLSDCNLQPALLDPLQYGVHVNE